MQELWFLCSACRLMLIDIYMKFREDLFVLRFYGPVNPTGVMLSAVSLPNHTFTGQA